MTAASIRARGQRLAERDMTDLGELRGPDEQVWNEETSQYETQPGPLKYAGKAKAQSTETIGRATDSAERVRMVTRFEIHVPLSAAAAAVDDVWRFTDVTHDPQLVGRKFRVASLMHKSYPTARRLAVEEVQS